MKDRAAHVCVRVRESIASNDDFTSRIVISQLCFEYLEILSLKLDSLSLCDTLFVVKREDMTSRKLSLLKRNTDNIIIIK